MTNGECQGTSSAKCDEGNGETASGDQPGGSDSATRNEDASRYECNICLDMAKDPVISMCGHLFCWPCLHTWLDTRPNRQLCPVCKSAISREKVIPLYGRGCADKTDPRDKIPPRPRGQRTEESNSGFHGFHWGGENIQGVQLSLGIGMFPLALFGTFLGFGNNDRRAEGAQGNAAAGTNGNSRQQAEEQFLSNVFFGLGLIFLAWLFFM